MKEQKIKCPCCSIESTITLCDFIDAFKTQEGYYNCSQCESVVFVKIDLIKRKIISAEVSHEHQMKGE